MYAIIDVETTGGRPNFDRVIEIAIVVYDGVEIINQYDTLIHPERSIPYNITQITGITDEMLTDAPKFYEVAKDIVQLTEGKIFVAHNVRFDYQFIRHEFQRLGFSFVRKQLCTVRLSRKVFPQLRSHSLDSMSRYLGISIDRRHRALDDTLATVKILETALQKGQENTLFDLVNFGVKSSKLPPNITLDALHQLPETCGVYFFHDKNGDVIYVGKSINIKKRIMQHFANTTTKANKMHEQVHEYTYEETGSELVSLLYESYLIKKIRPKHNRAQKADNYTYCIHTYTDNNGYINFGVAKRKKTLNIVTTFPKLRSAQGTLKRIINAYQLCERYCELDNSTGRCFKRHIDECFGACNLEENADSYNLRATEAMEAIKVEIEGNLIVIEEGRSSDELAVVLIEDGIYKGFGYVNKDDHLTLEDFQDSIKPYPHHPEILKIINNYIKDSKKVKLLRF